MRVRWVAGISRLLGVEVAVGSKFANVNEWGKVAAFEDH